MHQAPIVLSPKVIEMAEFILLCHKGGGDYILYRARQDGLCRQAETLACYVEAEEEWDRKQLLSPF